MGGCEPTKRLEEFEFKMIACRRVSAWDGNERESDEETGERRGESVEGRGEGEEIPISAAMPSTV